MAQIKVKVKHKRKVIMEVYILKAAPNANMKLYTKKRKETFFYIT